MRAGASSLTWRQCAHQAFGFENDEGESLGMGGIFFDGPAFGSWRLGPYCGVQWDVHKGDKVTLCLDVAQFVKDPDELPPPGEWRAYASAEGVRSTPAVISVRKLERRERVIARRLRLIRPVRPTLFPHVVVTPRTDDLPPESRRPLEVIRILRTATVSWDSGLDTIDRCDVEWGYLEPLIELIRYECLRETGQAEEAGRLREAHEEDYGKLTFDLIDRGDGLIARLRRLEASRTGRMKIFGSARGKVSPENQQNLMAPGPTGPPRKKGDLDLLQARVMRRVKDPSEW